MITLLIEPERNLVRWAIKQNEEIVRHGTCHDLENVRTLQEQEGIKSVWIDEGYRTYEVRAACQKYGWAAVKGMAGRRAMADVIHEATSHRVPIPLH